jgi:SAM-dependent methyltransferase
MSVFGAYSQYYDLLYRDKDYLGEAQYLQSLLERHQPGARSVLDLGCGTGRHALLLAESGYRMVGVDRSPEMLANAKAQLAHASPERLARLASSGALPSFVEGDLRTVRTGQKFDVVVSLFHVMSYQVQNADLRAAFTTAKEHLNPGGVFMFDCWYGPAVLTEHPTARTLDLENDQIAVRRTADPVSHPNQNSVDVNFVVAITDKQTGAVDELRETHTMRYLFTPEVELLLECCGFALKDSSAFMSDKPLGLDTWTALFVATSVD